MAIGVFHTIEAGKHVKEYFIENVLFTNHQKKEDTMEAAKTKSANQTNKENQVQTSTQNGFHSK
ncbi:hypothetical protein SAMN05192574_12169 [Mucilaginibacter gossypiicola]|uniref:Uncharacterized protein n=1 Tax=Mucilaginibacter gossypiicola TaxID=551995 RepID=A0A1H8V0H0_9SPHI|nr:hypothetical protein SAMN05192574_12169 [Mucilaginibacter gossypiicola]